MKWGCSLWWSTCGSAPCGLRYRRGCEDSGDHSKDQEVAPACRPVCLIFFSRSPRLLTRLGPLMSKSMCGCGCSIISSLMKRLGCAVCCSDLFSSHTSEQLQRLAAGCRPQPKVTPTRSHLCPLLNGALFDYSRKPRVMCCAESIRSDLGKSHMQKPGLLEHLLWDSRVPPQSHPIPVVSFWLCPVKCDECEITYLLYK